MKHLFLLGILLVVQTSAAFTYEDVVELVQKNKLTSIEQLIPLLPSEILSNYTMMYRSDSLQEASEENPRVIAFAPNAELILAFNGNKSQRNFRHLEMIQFRKDTKNFEFRSIDFSDPGQIIFSDPNPKQCLSCHGESPRPIWKSFL